MINSNLSSDDDTCSTLSFRNEEMIVEFMLQEELEKYEEQEGSVVKIDAYSSGEEEKKSEIVLEGEDEWSDKECRYLAQMNDPRFMTARQRSLLDKRSGGRESNLEEMNFIDQIPALSNRSALRPTGKAGDHRRAVKERQQEEQRVTVEKLLKVTPGSRLAKRARQLPQDNDNSKSGPSIRVVSSQRPECPSYVAFSDPDLCPIWQPGKPVLPATVQCSADGCTNSKRYSCARTGRPLCYRIECYRSIAGTN